MARRNRWSGYMCLGHHVLTIADTSQHSLPGGIGDFVISGLGITVKSGLTITVAAGTAIIRGVPLIIATEDKLLTASKDTYVDIDSAGAITYNEETIGDPAHTLAANSIRLATVFTSAVAATGITPTTTVVYPGQAAAYDKVEFVDIQLLSGNIRIMQSGVVASTTVGKLYTTTDTTNPTQLILRSSVMDASGEPYPKLANVCLCSPGGAAVLDVEYYTRKV